MTHTNENISSKAVEMFNGVSIIIYSNGLISTTDYVIMRDDGKKYTNKGKILKQGLWNGYYRITLSIKGVRKSYSVHRLVASTFIPNPENKPTINHINGIKTDNRIENLEWATYQEQKIHAINFGLCEDNVKALEVANKRRSIKVVFNGVEYNSIREAARITGCDRDKIKREGILL